MCRQSSQSGAGAHTGAAGENGRAGFPARAGDPFPQASDSERALISAARAAVQATCDCDASGKHGAYMRCVSHAAKPEVAYGHKASMLQDVEARRATEVDFLNGGIARFGREHGVPTPLHDTITSLIKGIEASWNQN